MLLSTVLCIVNRKADKVVLPDRTQEHSGLCAEDDYVFPCQLREGQLTERTGQSFVQGGRDRETGGGICPHRCAPQRGLGNAKGMSCVFCDLAVNFTILLVILFICFG